jgi:hypothetical protein
VVTEKATRDECTHQASRCLLQALKIADDDREVLQHAAYFENLVDISMTTWFRHTDDRTFGAGGQHL